MRNKSVKWLADHGWDQKEGNYIGMVLRWHIYIMLNRRCYSDLNDPTFKDYRPGVLKRQDLTDRTWKNKKTIFAAEFGLPESELSLRYIDFTPYMSLSPTAVHCNTPVLQLYNIYKGIGLRHLVVVGNKRQIVGIITAHELCCEEDLEEAVHRVHHYFEGKSEDEQNQLFEQRMSFLKGVTKRLTTSGNAWLHAEDAPNAHGIKKKKNKSHHGHHGSQQHDDNEPSRPANLLQKSMASMSGSAARSHMDEPGEDYDDNKTDVASPRDTDLDNVDLNDQMDNDEIQQNGIDEEEEEHTPENQNVNSNINQQRRRSE